MNPKPPINVLPCLDMEFSRFVSNVAEEELRCANHLPGTGLSREENISIVAQRVSSVVICVEPTWRPMIHSFLLDDKFRLSKHFHQTHY